MKMSAARLPTVSADIIFNGALRTESPSLSPPPLLIPPARIDEISFDINRTPLDTDRILASITQMSLESPSMEAVSYSQDYASDSFYGISDEERNNLYTKILTSNPPLSHDQIYASEKYFPYQELSSFQIPEVIVLEIGQANVQPSKLFSLETFSSQSTFPERIQPDKFQSDSFPVTEKPKKKVKISILDALKMFPIDEKIMKTANDLYVEFNIRHRAGERKNGAIGYCVMRAYEIHGISITAPEVAKLLNINERDIDRAALKYTSGIDLPVGGSKKFTPYDIMNPIISFYEDYYSMLFSQEYRSLILDAFTKACSNPISRSWNQKFFAIAFFFNFLQETPGQNPKIAKFPAIYNNTITVTTIKTYIANIKANGL